MIFFKIFDVLKNTWLRHGLPKNIIFFNYKIPDNLNIYLLKKEPPAGDREARRPWPMLGELDLCACLALRV